MSRKLLFTLSALAATGCWARSAVAEVVPHPLFQAGAVVQRDVPLKVWGTGTDGEAVSVRFHEAEARAVVAAGRWQVSLPAQPAAGPAPLQINKQIVPSVQVGDVYLCSGQSNMEWPLSLSDGTEQALSGPADPGLRMFRVQRASAPQPQELPVVQHPWIESDDPVARDFSAVAFHFGRALRKRNPRVAVGLIQAAWGGTVAEAWTSRSALEAVPELATLARPQGSESSSGLFNGMIHPLVGYPLRGLLWYQGEANVGRASQYRQLLPTMVNDWRQRWNTPLPFLFVQLAPFGPLPDGVENSRWAELRESQLQVAKTLPASALVVLSDVGDVDIHPRQKQPVGERLALAARHLVYGEKVLWTGPQLVRIRQSLISLKLTFEQVGGGLALSGGKSVTGFTLAGPDGKFQRVSARITGPAEVEISLPPTIQVRHLRYGWNDYPRLNLVNSAGLPAGPFEYRL